MIALFVLGMLGVVLVPLWFVGRTVQLARARPRRVVTAFVEGIRNASWAVAGAWLDERGSLPIAKGGGAK